MTGSIALTTQTTPQPRIGVQLSAWAAADGPITVKRVHADTTEWTVRGFGSTSAGQAFAWDYEAPFGQTVYYYALDALSAPVNAAFSTATTGGSLAAGTYYYRVSATTAAGETLASTETSIVVPAGTATNTVTVNWAAVTGATGYRVYGRATGAELFIASTSALTYTDTGSVTPAGALPTSNTAGTTKVTSASTSLPVSTPLLRGPGLPANDATFTLVEKPRLTRERPGAVLRPLGRMTAVALTASRFKPDFTVTVETHSDQEANTLLNTWTQSPVCLLLVPGVRDSWLYVFISKVEEVPFTPFLSSSNGDPGSWSQFALTCTTVDPPVGGIYGDPTASYAAVVSNYATYAALKTAKATYLDVVKGVP